jgi:hypothetical protein
MTKFLAGVLSVIAVGVLLIAYGLLNPAVPAYADQSPFARPMLANETMMLRDPNMPYAQGPAYATYPSQAYVYPAYQRASVPMAAPVRTVTTVEQAPRLEEDRSRDWRVDRNGRRRRGDFRWEEGRAHRRRDRWWSEHDLRKYEVTRTQREQRTQRAQRSMTSASSVVVNHGPRSAAAPT